MDKRDFDNDKAKKGMKKKYSEPKIKILSNRQTDELIKSGILNLKPDNPTTVSENRTEESKSENFH